MTVNASIGFFGKLPCNGDFLQRRVPQSFLDVWDPWLQECIHASRGDLQETWLSTYLTSPLWRFVLTDSVCGSGAYAGILAPSMDRVGRYFPLTVVAQIDIDLSPLEFSTQNMAWFDALDALVIRAFEEESIDLEWFDSQVTELGNTLGDEKESDSRQLAGLLAGSAFPHQHSAWRVPLRTAQGLQSAINAFAYRELSAQLRPISVWWTEGSGALTASWLNLRGLPQPTSFAAMLDGRWKNYGWNDLGEFAENSRPAGPAQFAEPASPDSQILLEPAAPQVTLPNVQLSAVEANRTAFITRADIGLWAVASTEWDADPSAVRLISDALQQLPAASSLTGLVESARHAMVEANRGLAQLAMRDIQSIESHANVVVLLLSGAECALLSAGDVQTFRIRGRLIEAVDLPTDTARESPPDSGSLMELLLGVPQSMHGVGGSNFRDMNVHYERMLREDQWILCARALLREADVARLAATVASGLGIDARGIADMLSPQMHPDEIAPILSLEL